MLNNNIIFIVGIPRSGTTFLSAILSQHSEICCGPETQFFNKFSRFKRLVAISDPFWPFLAVKKIERITIANQQVISEYGSSAKNVAEYLSTAPRNSKSLFMSVVNEFKENKKCNYILEKTPNHLLHIDDLRRTFPGCKIIRIVRDPRASALSMKKLEWASSDPVTNASTIQNWYELSKGKFSEDHKDHLTVIYEEWMKNPEKTLRNIFKFLEINFEEIVLKAEVGATDVLTKNETWKNQIKSGYDSDLVDYWKDELSEDQKISIAAICSDFLTDFKYER